MNDVHAHARHRMLERHLRARGIDDEAVLAAMDRVPREDFVPDRLRADAYADRALDIGHGQTISQPYVVALMASLCLLRAGERVLEVGGGSGYAAAVFAELGAEVWTLERHPALARAAEERLRRLGYDRVRVRVADGSLGLTEAAPFDAISVAASPPELPPLLAEQLRIGGRLVIPIGPRQGQRLVRVTRREARRWDEDFVSRVRFVPLVGAAGWPEGTA